MLFQTSKPYPINQVLSGFSASAILPPAAPLSAYLDRSLRRERSPTACMKPLSCGCCEGRRIWRMNVDIG